MQSSNEIRKRSLYEVFTRRGTQGDWGRRMYGVDRASLVGFFLGLKMVRGQACLKVDGANVEIRTWVPGDAAFVSQPGPAMAGFDWDVPRRPGLAESNGVQGNVFSKRDEAIARGNRHDVNGDPMD